jgi:intein/homing endonuclease
MLTSGEILNEYAKCVIDPKYAIETYLSTFDKTQEGFVPFNLFIRQKYIIDCYQGFRFNIVTKPRQAGISTTTQAYSAVKSAFADSKNPETIIVIANKLNLAKKFAKGIKDYCSQLPRWVWGPDYYGTEEKEKKSIFIKDSQIEIELPNGSKIIAVATSTDALRGYTPTLLIFDEAAFIVNGAELYSAAITSLGCLTKESLILTENGLVELDELVNEKKVLGFTNLDKPHIVCDKYGNLTPATQTFVSEYGKTFRIKTKLGIELEGSWKHPILVKRDSNEVWVRMNELLVGDKPVINYNQNYFGSSGRFDFEYKRNSKHKDIKIPSNLSDNLDFCYLLGLFVAEGNFNSRGITITNTDEYISNFLTNDSAKLGYHFIKKNEKHHVLLSAELVKWFECFGLKKHKAKYKEIPLPILKMPKEVIVNFLQGMFDGDGMSTVKDIKYSSTSKKLIKTLQTLLLNFGIISHIKKEVAKTSPTSIISNKEHICTIYNLKIYSNHALKFYSEIGFRLERKQKNVEHLIGKKLNSRYVDVSQETIEGIIKKNKLNKSKFRFLERFFNSKYNRLSYESLNRLLIEIPNDFELLELTKQINHNENYFIDEIIEITNNEDYTYDLHVPETNSFISNGVISHNTGGSSILISTPNGYDPLYYKTYEQSEKGENDYNVIELKWYQDPRYNKDLQWLKGDEIINEVEFTLESFEEMVKKGYKPTSTWYRDMCKGMNNDKKRIAQELDVSFLGSGGNVIDDEYINMHDTQNVEKPKFIDETYYDGNSGLVWIWNEPEEGHQYIMGSDVARGDGADFSCFQIIDFTTMEQVAEFQGKVPPDTFAEILNVYGSKYNAYLVVDNVGVGNTTVSKLEEMKYPNLHYDSVKTENGKKVAGFNINGVRLQLISHLEIAIRTNIIKIKSKRLINEMKTFIYKNGRPDHMEGYNDDCLMSLGMALWILESSFKKLKKLEKQTKAILSSWQVGSSSKKTDDIYNTGFVPKNKKNKSNTGKPNFNSTVAKNMQDPKGEYLWLFSGLK